jgi:disulfide bond formation protein DsbB
MTSAQATRIDRLPMAATPLRIALLVTLLALAAIAGAWMFEWAGYLPCELCLKQRWAYYAGVPVAALVSIAVAARAPRGLVVAGFVLVALIFAGSAVFGAYHAGVEWGFWQGPTDCTGTLSKAASVDDFMQQLQTTHVVRCDAVAIRILGLSLAGWNAVVSALIVALSIAGARLARR